MMHKKGPSQHGMRGSEFRQRLEHLLASIEQVQQERASQRQQEKQGGMGVTCTQCKKDELRETVDG